MVCFALWEIISEMTGVAENLLIEAALAEETLTEGKGGAEKDRCSKPFAVIVEEIVKFRLGQLVKNRFIVASVLRK